MTLLVCAVALACNSGLTSVLAKEISGPLQHITSTTFAKGALATYMLFQVIFGFTYTPLQGVMPAEALDTNMRAKGLAASGFIVGIVGFINTFCTPIANSSIGYRYIYIFVGWDIIETICWYLFWYVPTIVTACLFKQHANVFLAAVSSLKDVRWKSLSTSTASRIPSKHLYMLTRSSSNPTAWSPRKSWILLFKKAAFLTYRLFTHPPSASSYPRHCSSDRTGVIWRIFKPVSLIRLFGLAALFSIALKLNITKSSCQLPHILASARIVCPGFRHVMPNYMLP